MERKLIISLVFLIAGALSPGAARAEIKVVTTVPDLAALAREVGGERIEVKTLALPTQDPHFVDPKPSLVLELNRADLLIAVGVGLEVGWLPTLQAGARNAQIQTGGRAYLECARHVDLMDIPTRPVDRSMGDVHPGGNPHYLFDPRRAKQCASAIAEKLARLDPEGAGHYHERLHLFADLLERRAKRWKKRLAQHRGAAVVAYHRSWVYFTEWLGLEVVERLEPKPGIPPTPRHIARVIRLARKEGVKAIIQEGYYPNRTGKLVAGKIGAELVRLPGGADVASGETYLDNMEEMVRAVERALEK